MESMIFPIGNEGKLGHAHHVFTTRECADMVRDHFDAFMGCDGWHHVNFHGQAVRDLLAQEGVEGIRVAKAVHAGARTLVIFGLNKDGHITGAIALQNGEPCPPLC